MVRYAVANVPYLENEPPELSVSAGHRRLRRAAACRRLGRQGYETVT